MLRREFITSLGAAAGVMLLPPSLRQAQAANTPLSRYWLQITAGGGWDPLSTFDPYPSPARSFAASAITQVGPFSIGPFQGSPAPVPDPFTGVNPTTGYFNAFFTKYQNRLLIINGVDHSTGDHPTAAMYGLTGGLALPYPSYGALAAAVLEPSLPMAFCGYDTANIIGGSTASMPALQASAQPLLRMASPNLVNPSQTSTYLDPNSWNTVLQSINGRLARRQATETIPFRAQQRALMQVARADNDNTALVTMLDNLFSSPVNPNDNAAQVDVIMACFGANLAFAAELGLPGGMLGSLYTNYDAHQNHDARMYPLMDATFRLIDYVMTRADALKLPLNVVVSSDFSRTPGYNAGGGTDHNPPACSYLLIGPDFSGGRVIGKTLINTYGYAASPLDPTSLQPDPGGVTVNAAHIHAALRHVSGIDTNTLAATTFPINEPVLPFFA